jgi:hypothetical protein
MRTGFIPIGLNEYVDLHLRANAGVERADLVERLQNAIASAERGERCRCGRPIWIIGSAEAGLSCFTCITGEAQPDQDYEIDITKPQDPAEPAAAGNSRPGVPSSSL